MATDATETGTLADVMADALAVAEHAATGKPLDPAVAQRVRARAAQARQQILADHGIHDIGVQIIREIRGDFGVAALTTGPRETMNQRAGSPPKQ